MSGNDRGFKIRIYTEADTSGAKETLAALDELKSKTDQASESTKKHSGHIEGLHKLFHSLNEIIPGTGFLLQAAFSPIGATIGIAGMALRAFHERLAEINAEFKRLEEEAAKPATNRLEAMREGVIKTASGMAALKDRLDQAARGEIGLKEATEAALASMHAQGERAKALADELQAVELARLEDTHAAGLIKETEYAEKRLQIEADFQKRKHQLEENAKELDILVHRRALEEAGVAQPGLTATAQAAEEKRQKALENLASQPSLSDLAKNKEKAESELKAFEENTPWVEAGHFGDIGPGLNRGDLVKELSKRGDATPEAVSAYEQWAQLKIAEEMARGEWKAAPGAMARATVEAERAGREAERTSRAAEQNQEFITSGQRSLGIEQGEFRAQHQANQQSNQLQDLRGAYVAASSLRGQASDLSRQITTAITQHSGQVDSLIALLDSVNGKLADQDNKIRLLESQLKGMRHQP